MPQLTTCEQTPELTTVGENAKLSTRPGRATLLWKTLQEAEVVTHVPSVAGVGSKHSPCSSLVAAKEAKEARQGQAPPGPGPDGPWVSRRGDKLQQPGTHGKEHRSRQRGLGLYMQIVQVVPREAVRHQLAQEAGGRSASTWTPLRKRSISPQGGTIRCKSPHICRSAATGGCRSRFMDPNPSTRLGRAEISRSRSITQEGRERSPATREKLSRWPRVHNLEKERMNRVWSRMEKEQAAISDTRDALLKVAGKGTTELWQMKQRVEDIMAGLRETFCEACWDECRGQDRREEMSRRAPSNDMERPSPQPNKESPAGGEKEKPPVVVTSGDGTSACEPGIGLV